MWLVGCGLVWLCALALTQQEGRLAGCAPGHLQPAGRIFLFHLPNGLPSRAYLGTTRKKPATCQELLALTKLPTICERKMISVLPRQMRTLPELRGYTDIIHDFLQQHVSASLMSEEMAWYLAENSTEHKMLQLKAIVEHQRRTEDVQCS